MLLGDTIQVSGNRLLCFLRHVHTQNTAMPVKYNDPERQRNNFGQVALIGVAITLRLPERATETQASQVFSGTPSLSIHLGCFLPSAMWS